MAGNLIWIFLAVFIAWIFWSRQRSKVSLIDAKEHIKNGALILDVRSINEFAEKNLAGAVNLPLDQVAGRIESLESNKERIILCHCLSGGRSGMAVNQLKKLGYTQCFNLGSYGQAARVLDK